MSHPTLNITRLGLFALVAISTSLAVAEPKQGFSTMFGVLQPVAFQGGNVAVTYTSGRWMYEYSHGFNLKLHKFQDSLTNEEKDEKMELTLPWTTGASVGYYLTDEIAIAIELKAHRYEARHPEGGDKSYTTYSVGPGLYYNKYFGDHFFIQPVLRFWPNVSSSEDSQKVKFQRTNGSVYEHKVHDFGLFLNLSVGYTF